MIEKLTYSVESGLARLCGNPNLLPVLPARFEDRFEQIGIVMQREETKAFRYLSPITRYLTTEAHASHCESYDIETYAHLHELVDRRAHELCNSDLKTIIDCVEGMMLAAEQTVPTGILRRKLIKLRRRV